jgi:hypothetical protein
VAERAALSDLATALKARLSLFDDYEAAAAELAQAAALEAAAAASGGNGDGGDASSSSNSGVSTDALLKVLARLDGVAAKVAAHPHYADAAAYAARLRGLQQRAAALVRGRVGAALRSAARAVAQAAAEAQQQQAGNPSTASDTNQPSSSVHLLLPEAAEVSLLGVKYRAAAEPPLRPLISGLADLAAAQRAAGRAGGPDDCGRLLAECRALVAANRAEVLAPFAAARSAALRNEGDASALLRSGGERLLRAARQEAALMDALFGASGVVAAMPVGAGFGAGAGVAGAGTAPPPATATPFQQQPQPATTAAHHRTAADAAADALRVPLEPLASGFYDALRPRIVKLSDVDAICALIDVLQGELLVPQAAAPSGQASTTAAALLHASAAADAARPVLERALADLRGRLIFRAQAVVSEAVAGYRPGASEGWESGGLADYPERLEALRQKRRKEKETATRGERAAAEAAAGGDPTTEEEEEDAILIVPPVREALSLLTKLYRRLDGRTFGGLAQEAVAAACQAVLGPGSRALSARHGPLDAQLFAVAHLLHLRERIGAFEGADFAAVEVDLDFTHMYGHVRRLLIGGAGGAAGGAGGLAGSGGSGGLLGTATALLLRKQGSTGSNVMAAAAAAGADTSFSTGAAAAGTGAAATATVGAVRALTSRLDAKRDLERALRAACEDLIMSLTRQAADPLVAFLTKAAAVGAGAGAGGSQKDKQPLAERPLREHVFASAQRVGEAVSSAHAALDGALPSAAARAALYLPSSATRGVLLRPVRSNVSEAYSQVRAVVEREYKDEEKAAIGLRSQEELERALAALAA